MNRTARRGGTAALVLAVLLAALTSCSSAESTESKGPTVDACPDNVPPLDKPALPATAAKVDPHSITGPSTATLPNEDVEPVSTVPTPALPVTVNSCDGEQVVVEDVSRIIAVDLNGSIADVVFGLGLGGNVVGRDRSTDFPAARDIPLVTPSAHDLNAEAILNLDPTVVLTDSSIGPPEVLEQLRDVGVPVVFFDDDRSLAETPAHVTAIADALGVPDAGAELLQRMGKQFSKAVATVPSFDDPLRIAFLYVRGSAGIYLLAGPGSGADDLIDYVGGIDVGTDIGLDQPFTPLTAEAMVNAAPDVLLVMTEGLASVGGVDALLELPGINETSAADNRRVVDMADDAILSFGTRSPQVVAALVQALYHPGSS